MVACASRHTPASSWSVCLTPSKVAMESQCGDLRAGLTFVQLVESGWRLGPAPPDHGPRGVDGEREPLQVPQQCGGSPFHDLALRFGRNVVPYVAVGVWVPHATNELRVIRGRTPCIAGPTRYTSARRAQRSGTRQTESATQICNRRPLTDRTFPLSI